MSDSFTNRHGKKTSVDGEVDEITVEETKPVVKTSKRAEETPREKRKHKLKGPSKKLLIVSTVTLLIVGLSYIVAADTARRDFDRVANYTADRVSEIKAQSISEETTAADALRGLNQKLGMNEACQSAMPNIIYSAYPPARQSLSRCNEIADKYTELRLALGAMEMTATYLKQQSDVIQPALATPVDGAYAEIPVYASATQKAVEALKAVQTVPDDLTAQHQALISSIETLASAWAELSAANNAQNAEAFTAAEKTLASAYEAIRVHGDEINAVVADQQRKISDAAAKF